MIHRIVKLTFEKEKIDSFLIEFEKVKEKVVHFPGCLEMNLLQSTSDMPVFFTFSVWESEDDLESYRISPTFTELWSTIKPWFAAKPEAWTLDRKYTGRQ